MSWESGALLGEYTTRSFGAYPKEDNVSHLSQILEGSPHPKYCLSARACQGILTRAEKRGRELPPELKTALVYQIENYETICREMLTRFKNAQITSERCQH